MKAINQLTVAWLNTAKRFRYMAAIRLVNGTRTESVRFLKKLPVSPKQNKEKFSASARV